MTSMGSQRSFTLRPANIRCPPRRGALACHPQRNGKPLPKIEHPYVTPQYLQSQPGKRCAINCLRRFSECAMRPAPRIPRLRRATHCSPRQTITKKGKKRLFGGLQNRIRPSAIGKKRRPEIAKHICRWPVPDLACGLPDDDTGKRDLSMQGLPERLLGSLMRLYRRLRQWLFKPVGPDGLVASVANRMVTRRGCRTLWPEIRQGRISRQARPKLPRSGSSDSRSERSAMARGANSESRASILHRRTTGGRAPTSLNRPRHGQAAAWPQGRTPARDLPLGGRLFAALSVAACRPGHPGQQERNEPHFNISHFIHPGVCSDDGRCHRAICDCPHSNTSVLPNG